MERSRNRQTAEKRKATKDADKAYRKAKRAKETPQEKTIRSDADQHWHKTKRKGETPEEKAVRNDANRRRTEIYQLKLPPGKQSKIRMKDMSKHAQNMVEQTDHRRSWRATMPRIRNVCNLRGKLHCIRRSNPTANKNVSPPMMGLWIRMI